MIFLPSSSTTLIPYFFSTLSSNLAPFITKDLRYFATSFSFLIITNNW